MTVMPGLMMYPSELRERSTRLVTDEIDVDAGMPGSPRFTVKLNTIQSKLSYYRAWTRFESPGVGPAYERLPAEMRKVAGGAMHEAWSEPPIQNDSEMNIPVEQVDLRPLSEAEDNYISAVTARLDELTPARLRRK
jgi:hypothetical protein